MTLFKIHTILTEMLHDRGYDVRGENTLTQSEFEKLYPTRDSLSAILYKSSGEPILVSYLQDSNKGGSIGIEPIRKMIKTMKDEKLRKGIVVIPEKLSSAAEKDLANVKKDTEIEVFLEADLGYNITKHRLQPKFKIAGETEVKDLIQKMSLNPDKLEQQLPKMFVTDPIAKYYAFQPGQIIRVERERSLYYRIVV